MRKGGLGFMALGATAMLPLALLGGAARADTLQEALTAAYRNNPTLAAARAGQRATDESVPIQKAAGRPNLGVTGGYTEFVQSSSDSGISPERGINANLNLAVPVYSGGAVRNGIRGAEESSKQISHIRLRNSNSLVLNCNNNLTLIHRYSYINNRPFR